MQNVVTAPGLRIHIIPKVGSAAISNGLRDVQCRPATKEEPSNDFRMTVVRHPLDRMVSAWSYFCNPESNTTHELSAQNVLVQLGYYHTMSFKDFYRICMVKHAENAHTRMQTTFLGPHPFNLICPLERLNEAWDDYLFPRFPYLIAPLPRVHGSSRGPWEDYYTDTMRKNAEALFEKDIELYQFAKQDFTSM